MKSVPLKDLKENLSSWVEKASNGDIIQVTKYNRPYVILAPGELPGLVRGRRAGQGGLTSLFKEATGGKWLKILDEDRDD